MWGNPNSQNPQGQNKVLLWKEENNSKQRQNSQAINNEQWKKYQNSLNGSQLNNANKPNWNELIGVDNLENRNSVPGTPITTNTLAWNNDNSNSMDG